MESRSQLTRAILLAELLLLVISITACAFWFQSSIRSGMADQAIEDNHLIAEQMGRIINGLSIDDLSIGSDDWRKLQRIVAQTQLPNGGYLCVIGSDSGELICHPDLERNPALAGFPLGGRPLETSEGTRSIVDHLQDAKLASGRSDVGGEVHLLAAKRLDHVRANLLVHQRLPVIDAKAAERVRPVYWIGGTVGLVLMVATGRTSSRLLKNYDLHLERLNVELEHKVVERTDSLMKTRNAIIIGLAQLSESRDNDTGEHLDRISCYSTTLATAVGSQIPEVDRQFVDTIGFASSLHDIGKVGVPDAVLLKPGRLTPQERDIIETHPVIGAETLSRIERELGDDNFLQMAHEICIAHHEKWDGSGYPLGLQGEQIPLAARIVAVADVYDALTSKRPYKDAMSHREASSIIRESAGTHFDPAVVRAFEECNSEFRRLCCESRGELVHREEPVLQPA